MKNNILDIAYDRKALRELLQAIIKDLQSRNITTRNWMQNYTTMPKFEYKYDTELRECRMYEGRRLQNTHKVQFQS